MAAVTTGIVPPTATLGTLTKGSTCATDILNLDIRSAYTPKAVDLLVAMDLTGSMAGIIGAVKVAAMNFVNGVQAKIPDSRFALFSHMDYPGFYSFCGYSTDYGAAGVDYPYYLDLALTSDAAAFATSVSGLVQGDGWDGPEDYARVYYEAYSDPYVGWRSSSTKILLQFLDNRPHDCSIFTGIDPGRDGIDGTADDLTMDQVVAGLKANNIILIIVYSGSATDIPYWTTIATATGGAVFQMNPDGTVAGSVSVVDYLTLLVTTAVTKFNTITLKACNSAQSGYVGAVVPSSYVNKSLSADMSLPFSVSICAPTTACPGGTSLALCAIGDGAEIARQTVTFNVAGSACVVTPTPTPAPTLPPTVTRVRTTTPTPEPTASPLASLWLDIQFYGETTSSVTSRFANVPLPDGSILALAGPSFNLIGYPSTVVDPLMWSWALTDLRTGLDADCGSTCFSFFQDVMTLKDVPVGSYRVDASARDYKGFLANASYSFTVTQNGNLQAENTHTAPASQNARLSFSIH